MSDPAKIVPGVVADNETAGMLLRRAREASGLHVAALAVSMKVPVKKLEALEADRLEDLPDAVFVRALAASVCRTLKVDPTPVLNKLPTSAAPRLDTGERGVSMPAQKASFLAGQSMGALASRPSVVLVAALLLGALAVVFFPEARNGVGFAEQAPPPVAAVPAAAVAKSVDAGSPAVVPAKIPVTLASPPAPADASVAVVDPASVVAAVPAKVAPVTVVGSSLGSAGEADLLVFKAKSHTWVRVSDSRGVVQFEKTLAPGESAATSGAAPLKVVVGNVAATEVVLRGQPFPLDTLTQNNVARFEVK